ncbi:MAG: DNRLRE domain-containing protein [Anaerolineae bacterium]
MAHTGTRVPFRASPRALLWRARRPALLRAPRSATASVRLPSERHATALVCLPSQRRATVILVTGLALLVLAASPGAAMPFPEPKAAAGPATPPVADPAVAIDAAEYAAPHRLNQSTVDLEPVSDATLTSLSPDANLGHEHYLGVWYRSARDMRHSLIRFNLAAAVPPAAVIDEAHLDLQLDGSAGANPVNVTATLIAEDWIEGQVTWNSRPAVGEPSSATSIDAAPGVKRLDVTDIVRGWHNVPHYGLELRGPGDGTVFDRVFESREHGEAVPRLFVTFHVPPPPTPTPSMTPGSGTPGTGTPGTPGTPEATWTATATLRPGCAELIENGDFESEGLAGWGAWGDVGHASPGRGGASGTGAAWLGGRDEAGGELWQTVRIRAGADPVRLEYWWIVEREEPQPGDALEVLVQYGFEQADHLRSHLAAEPAGVWRQEVVDLADYAGMELAVTFLAHTDGVLPSTFELADDTLKACGRATCSPPPPTSTATPTTTPTDTSVPEATWTVTASATASEAVTASATIGTGTATVTASHSPSATAGDTFTPSATTGATGTPTRTPTYTPTRTPTGSATVYPTGPATPTHTPSATATGAIGTGLCTWTDVSPGPGSTPQPNTPWKASIWGRMLSLDITGEEGVVGPAAAWTTYDGPTLVDGLAAVASDGRLIMFFSYPGSPWKAVDVTEKTGQKVAVVRPAYWLFNDTVGPYEMLAAPATNSDLYVFAWRAETDWRALNVSAQLGVKVTGPIAAWITSSGGTETEHLAARSTSDRLLVFDRTAGAGTKWQVTDVSAATSKNIGAPPAAYIFGSPTVTERVAAQAANGDLLLFDRQSGSGWNATNLTTATGQKISGRLTAWISPSGPQAHNLAGAAPNGDLVIVHSDPIEGGWSVTNVTNATGQKTAGEATSWQTQSGGTSYEHLAVQGTNQHLYAFHKASGGSWQVKDVTAVTGPTIAYAPAAWLSEAGSTDTENLVAPSWYGRLHAYTWDPATDWGSIDVSLTAAGRKVYATSEKAGVWLSRDYGVTWGQLTRPQPAQGADAVGALDVPIVHDVIVSPDDPLLIVAATGADKRTPSRSGLYRSTDGGATWSRVHQFFCGGQVQPATQVVLAPGDATTMYAVGGCSVAVSTNSGATWTDTALPGTAGLLRAWHVAVSESLPGDVRRAFACGHGTLWYSHDSGTTWQRDAGATGSLPATACDATALGNGDAAQLLAIEPGHPSSVYIAHMDAANGRSYFHHEEAGVDGVYCNNSIVYDADNDNRYDAGETYLWGARATDGDALADDPKILFVDADGDGVLDAAEAMAFDASGDGKYGTVSSGRAELMLRGDAPTPGTSLADDPKIKHVAKGSAFGLRDCGEGSLWYGDLSSFDPTNPGALHGTWEQVPGPPVYWGAGSSGAAFVKTQEIDSGYLLFFSDTGTLHVSDGKPSAGDWHRLEGWDVSRNKRETDSTGNDYMKNIVAVHVDPHGLAISPDFDLTLKRVTDQRQPYQANKELDECIAGRLWFSNDGGVFRTDDCGETWIRAEAGLSTLASINIGGVARTGTPPALFMGTGDNDDFHSQDGGKTWRSSVDACADCGTWFGDPTQPDRVLSTSRTIAKQGAFAVYANPGSYPDAAVQAQQTLVPPPPTVAPSSGAKLIQRPGFRPLVQTISGQSPLADGDYVQIQEVVPPAPAAAYRRLMRARDSVGSSTVWSQVGPDLPSSVTVVQPAGGHASPTFYVGDYTRLWKSVRDAQGQVNQWQQIVPGGGAAVAQRFFVNPYDGDEIYILDTSGARHSTDGGTTWPGDASLDAALTDGGELVNTCRWNPTDIMHVIFDDCALNDMVFDQRAPSTRFAVGMAGVFYTGDGTHWLRLLDTRALPSRPTGAYFNPITDPNDRALYVAFLGRGVMRCDPIPATHPTPVPTSAATATNGPSPTPTSTPTATATSLPSAPLPGFPLIGNGGFEGDALAPWDMWGAAEIVEAPAPVHGGTRGMRLGKTEGVAELWQAVELPADAEAITLSFWWHIDSEDDWPLDGDKLRLLLRTPDGTAQLQTLTNAGPLFQWRQTWYDLSAYRGQTVTVLFRADENARDPTSFYIDDVRVDAHYPEAPTIYVPIAPQRVVLRLAQRPTPPRACRVRE